MKKIEVFSELSRTTLLRKVNSFCEGKKDVKVTYHGGYFFETVSIEWTSGV